MYAISNKNFEEILELLDSLKDLPGKDLRTINKKTAGSSHYQEINQI